MLTITYSPLLLVLNQTKPYKTKHCAAFRSVSSFGLRKRLGRLLQVGRLLEAFIGARRATARLRSQHLAQLLEVDSAW